MAVCCLDEAGTWGEQLRDEGIAVEALGRRAGFHPTFSRRVAAAAKRHHANVIHAHQYSPFVYGSIARLWQPSVRVIFTEHGRLSDAPPSTKRRVANWMLSRVPYEAFAVSDDLKKHMVAEGFAHRRVNVIHNGIEVGPPPNPTARRTIRTELGVSDGEMIVGTIARLDQVKDLGTLIRAVERLNHDLRVTLLIVGDGPERANLEALAVAGTRKVPVRFLGHRDDARDVLAGCDAYANSSISEGISLTILEAMAAQLPVVATNVGGTPEIIDATCGRLIPARNPEALKDALLGLTKEPTLRQRLGQAARQRVTERFTLERMVAQYRDAYFRAVGA